MSVPGFSDVECACGCENLIPLRAFERGWKYLRGHKPKGNAGSAAGRQGTRKSRVKVGLVVQASYALTLEMVRENLAAVRARHGELFAEHGAKFEQLRKVEYAINGAEAEIERLTTLCEALRPFVDPPVVAEVAGDEKRVPAEDGADYFVSPRPREVAPLNPDWATL